MSLDPITAAFDLGKGLIDRLIPDPAAKAAATLELIKMQQSGDLANLAATADIAKGQLTVNTAEAGSASTFVSGWRPAVGWVCASGCAYQFVAAPLLTWGAALAGHAIVAPSLDLSSLMMLLTGMLGLGSLRTVEKLNGVAAK